MFTGTCLRVPESARASALTSVAGTTAGNYTNFNIDVDNSAGLLGGVISPNSLRFNTALANSVTLAAGSNVISSGILATSAAGNNGSAFGGFAANTPYHNLMIGLAMLLGRFGYILPVLAIAGSLAAKKSAPLGSNSFPTHGPLFVTLLTLTILLVGGLTFLPALALGPLAEHLAMLQAI
mgnify:CR=1 FL=1